MISNCIACSNCNPSATPEGYGCALGKALTVDGDGVVSPKVPCPIWFTDSGEDPALEYRRAVTKGGFETAMKTAVRYVFELHAKLEQTERERDAAMHAHRQATQRAQEIRESLVGIMLELLVAAKPSDQPGDATVKKQTVLEIARKAEAYLKGLDL